MSNALSKKDLNTLAVAVLGTIIAFVLLVLGGGLVTYLLVNAVAAGSPLAYGKAVALTVLAFWTGAVVAAGTRLTK